MNNSVIVSAFAPVTPEQVKTTLDKGLSVAQMLVKLTPNTTDDMVVAAVAGLVAQPWFVNVVVWAVNQLAEKKSLDLSHAADEIKLKFGK
jgi:hypothetical protein